MQKGTENAGENPEPCFVSPSIGTAVGAMNICNRAIEVKREEVPMVRLLPRAWLVVIVRVSSTLENLDIIRSPVLFLAPVNCQHNSDSH